MKEQAAVRCCDECHHTDSYIHVNTDSFKNSLVEKKPPVGGFYYAISHGDDPTRSRVDRTIQIRIEWLP